MRECRRGRRPTFVFVVVLRGPARSHATSPCQPDSQPQTDDAPLRGREGEDQGRLNAIGIVTAAPALVEHHTVLSILIQQEQLAHAAIALCLVHGDTSRVTRAAKSEE